MPEAYDHQKIEEKWQTEWEKSGIYSAQEKSEAGNKEKFYCLVEFPFPSGDGLHVGHIRSYTALDILARKRRMQGQNVLYPMGWDAFGLPTENYAIKTGKAPALVTQENTDNFRKQLKALGFSFDWSREINTTSPEYYKWTQWLFLQFYKNNLAYKKKTLINWCPKDKIGLANEEVIDGKCERCGTAVEQREKEQWMLAITKYADRLDKDLDSVDYLEKIKVQQRNWIGRSEGAEIEFPLVNPTPDPLPKGEGDNYGYQTADPGAWRALQDKALEMRKNPTEAENGLWQMLRDNKLDCHFRRQHIIGQFIVDFVCLEKMLIVEVDGDIHDYQKEGDAERTAFLEELGFKVIRFKNADIIEDVNLVTEKIVSSLQALPLGEGAGGVIKIFTTRPETIFGATYLAIAGKEDKFTGQYVTNPATGEPIPVWEAEYVMSDVGTGALMGVPAHDERDFAFAKKNNLPVVPVVRANKGVYVIIEKSLPLGLDKELSKFGEVKIEKIDKNWGKFYHLTVESGHEPKLIEFLKSNMSSSSDGGGAWYADSLGTTNHIVFPNKDFEVWSMKDIKTAHDYAISVNIPESQIINSFDKVYMGVGVLVNSGEFSGLTTAEAREKITAKFGTAKTTYKLRDWVFSRQRYWGEPIPMIYCAKCGWQAVSESDLPVILPEVKEYQPRDDGESPLASVSEWVNVKCPKCSSDARRETDTMPNWAGSSWYYLRYCDPENSEKFASAEKLKYWLGESGVDWYNGGMEHTTLHLLYSRFWHKFLFDLKLVPNSEPYQKRTSHGLILAEGGVKMSKSKPETIINPDKIVELYGADTLRLYEMFMGPFEQAVAWNTESIIGPRRFLERVWKLSDNLNLSGRTEENLANAVKKITDDLEALKFNTAVSGLMILLNSFEKNGVNKEGYETFLKLLAPFAPHITEELWQKLGNNNSIHTEKWPEMTVDNSIPAEVKIVIQVNGTVRDTLIVKADDDQEKVQNMALQSPKVQKWVDNKEVKKVVYIPRRLLNFVIYDNI